MNSSSLNKIIIEKLDRNNQQLSEQFFSHNKQTFTKFFILDGLLPENIALDIYNNFPNKKTYHLRDTFRERKFTYAKLNNLKNPIVQDITNAFLMDNVVNIISQITDIQNLESDPSLYASGISRMDKGHFLNPHIDNSHDMLRKRYRRLNLLYYVTPDLKESDGGNFELWDKKVKSPLKIPPKFNRLVLMETTKYSWHSVDHVHSNIQRCCVSNYYFSKSSPEQKEYYHVTSFLGRPDEKARRLYGIVDNLLRNTFVKLTGLSRGKNLGRASDEK